jgi:hypothetical protein
VSKVPVVATTPPPARTQTPPEAKTKAPEVNQNEAIARMLARVSKMRGLPSKRPVAGITLERAQMIARIKEKVDREIPPEAVANEGDSLKLLGLIPTNMDYLATTLKLLEAQLAGFYEPKDEHMYLAADLDDDNAEVTLAHELEHALQDQNFDLKSRADYKPGHGDEQMAFSALVEGDATSTMIDVTVGRMKKGMTAVDLPEGSVEDQIQQSVEEANETKHIPHAMKADLVAPYVYGTHFIHTLRRNGGWADVNKALARPPSTTEQILHPEKWTANEAALTVAAPSAPASQSGLWKMVDEDTEGELGLALLFAEWVGKESAFRIVSGWGGDRSATFTNGDLIAAAVHVEYDAAAGAKSVDAAFRALADAVGAKPLRGGSVACVDRGETGPLAFVKSGKRLSMFVGPAKKGTTWTSAASCKDAAFQTWATQKR